MNKKDYYQNHSDFYIKESASFTMDQFYNFLLNEVKFLKQPKFLDLGFGSGRDMLFLAKKGFNVEGVDSCDNFIERMKKMNFKVYKENLPEINIQNKFDCIYSVGLLMHLNENEIDLLLSNLYKLLNDSAILILSYNDMDRTNDTERLFFKITQELINKLAIKNNFKLNKVEVIIDKRNINWFTESYVKDIK